MLNNFQLIGFIHKARWGNVADTDPTCPPTMGTPSSSSRCLSSCREMTSASQKKKKKWKAKKDLEEPGPKQTTQPSVSSPEFNTENSTEFHAVPIWGKFMVRE